MSKSKSAGIIMKKCSFFKEKLQRNIPGTEELRVAFLESAFNCLYVYHWLSFVCVCVYTYIFNKYSE